MKILAIDTSSAILSVAACHDEQLATRMETAPRQHAEQILEFVDAVLLQVQLKLPQLDAIAYGYGPGSFTSLRIGLGVVQGLALGASLRVIPVSSLLAVAQANTAKNIDQAVVCMDARMGEVYTAHCRRNNTGLMRLETEEQVLPPSEVTFPDHKNWLALGNGYTQYADRFPSISDMLADSWPLASAIIELAEPDLARGETLDPATVSPKYVRNKVAKTTKERQ